jgi:hypothetical protein
MVGEERNFGLAQDFHRRGINGVEGQVEKGFVPDLSNVKACNFRYLLREIRCACWIVRTPKSLGP